MDTKPKSHRLRIGRFSESNRIYLITTVTHRRKPVFQNFYLGRLLVQILRAEHPRTETLAYVVMPDHLHWLIQLKAIASLSKTVASIKSISAHRINQKLNQHGRVWQPGFHDHAIRKEEDIKAIARYVIANPVRAQLVENIGGYPLWDAIWI